MSDQHESDSHAPHTPENWDVQYAGPGVKPTAYRRPRRPDVVICPG